MRRSATAAVLFTVAVASLALTAYQYVFPKSVTAPPTSTSSVTTGSTTTCIIQGQPRGIFLRVLSNSTLKPAAGVFVTAINRPALCNGSPATTRVVKTFTTNGTEWFPLPSDNNAVYSFVATYSGRTYNFTADLRPVSMTCATLYLPSGQTDLTVTEFGGACATILRAAPPFMSEVAVANITISGYPNEIAINPSTGRIYVSDLFANKLVVIEASTHSVIGTITLPGTSKSGIVVDPRSNVLYVPVFGCTNLGNATNRCDSVDFRNSKGAIVEIDGATNTIVREIPVEVDRLTINPSTSTLYGVYGNLNFGSNASGFLLAIDENSGSLIANTSLNAFPLGIAVDAKANVVYIAACKRISLPCEGAEVLTVNETGHYLQSVVPLNFDALNFRLVFDATTDTIYTMGLDGANLTLVSIDGASGKVQYTFAIGSSCAGAGGGSLALNTASNEIYVSFNSQQFFITLDASTGKIAGMLSTPNGIQYATYNPATLQTYVTLEAHHKNVGYFVILPGAMNESFVNGNLLQLGICLP